MNDEEMAKRIGNEFKRLRKMNKFTQQQVAEFTGLSQSYIGNIENGNRLPKLSYVRTLLEFYDVKFNKFFRIIDED